MKTNLSLQNKVENSLVRGKIVSIDLLTGRVAVFMRNGLVTTGTYLYDISELRVGMTVLVGRVDNSYVIMNKVFNVPRFGRSFSVARPSVVIQLTASPSGEDGYSTVWSDPFPGFLLNMSKWTVGHGSPTVSGGRCNIDPASYVLYETPCYIGWVVSKAPNWDNFSAVIVANGNYGEGGVGIGWWNEGYTWGLVYTMYKGVNTWVFFTPMGFRVAPYICDPYNWNFSIKVVKTPTTATGYYKTTGDWILISSCGTPPLTAVHIGVGGLYPTSHFIGDFKTGFGVSGLFVDLSWTGSAASYVLRRDGDQIYTGSDKAFTDTDTEIGTIYFYELIGYNEYAVEIGNSSAYATTR